MTCPNLFLSLLLLLFKLNNKIFKLNQAEFSILARASKTLATHIKFSVLAAMNRIKNYIIL